MCCVRAQVYMNNGDVCYDISTDYDELSFSALPGAAPVMLGRPLGNTSPSSGPTGSGSGRGRSSRSDADAVVRGQGGMHVGRVVNGLHSKRIQRWVGCDGTLCGSPGGWAL